MPLKVWNEPSWYHRAACGTSGADLFFPAGRSGAAVDDIDAAKRVCARCPVRTACLAFAIETNQEYGVWGGTTEDERRPLRKEHRLGSFPGPPAPTL
jgi:WhiB family transcriptional regulator, redox-sensing transcriptional regulator